MIETKPQRWRSRHPNYRFRGVQFHNNCATVISADDIEAAARNPFFGRDRDFWRDDVQPEAAAVAASANVDPTKVDPPADPPAPNGKGKK